MVALAAFNSSLSFWLARTAVKIFYSMIMTIMYAEVSLNLSFDGEISIFHVWKIMIGEQTNCTTLR